MYKKEITYTDFLEEEHTETCWFNLSEADMLDLQLAPKQGLQEYMAEVMEDLDNHREEVLNFIKKLILKAYGVRREIGGKVLFTKTDDDKLLFQYGGAFDAVYTEFLKNPNEIYAFIQGASPKRYRDSFDEAQSSGKLPSIEQIETNPQQALEIIKSNAENSNS